MEFSEVVQKRRSVRKYSEGQVPDNVVERALTEALLAPNTSNIQPWEFYWVKTPETHHKLVEACYGQSAAKTADQLIVAVANLSTWKRNAKMLSEILRKQEGLPKGVADYYDKLIPSIYTQGPLSVLGFVKRVVFWFVGWFRPVPRTPHSYTELRESLVKTVALGCQNFILSITNQGYGCCPMEGFDENRVRRALNLHRHQRVVMIISIGEAATDGIWGEQVRLDRELFIKKV